MWSEDYMKNHLEMNLKKNKNLDTFEIFSEKMSEKKIAGGREDSIISIQKRLYDKWRCAAKQLNMTEIQYVYDL